ncbi:MAG: phosphate-starvation-inducible PsiE family protein [Ardenticatenaceae bacterium]|nr:phosphate-starvation-inducible PsiE family protein [Ardenticatenaceae bacterium]
MGDQDASPERGRASTDSAVEGEAAPAEEVIEPVLRDRITSGFSWLEDIVYVGLGVLLGCSALVLLFATALRFLQDLLAGTLTGNIVDLLDRILLVLIFVELLYTVEVTFRERVLAPEPFLIIALIAAIRRVLVLTAGIAELLEQEQSLFRNAMFELGLLTLLILALVLAIVLLRRRHPQAVAQRGGAQSRSTRKT